MAGYTDELFSFLNGGVLRFFVEDVPERDGVRRRIQPKVASRVILRQVGGSSNKFDAGFNVNPELRTLRGGTANEFNTWASAIQPSKKEFIFPFGPKEVSYGEFALNYSEVQRPGKKPLLRAVAPKNRTVTMSAVIADPQTGGAGTVEERLRLLELLASEDVDLTFQHGGVVLPYHVRMVRLAFSSVQRTLSGEITQAKAEISLQESIPLRVRLVHLAAVLEEPTLSNTADDETDGDKIASDHDETNAVMDAAGTTVPVVRMPYLPELGQLTNI